MIFDVFQYFTFRSFPSASVSKTTSPLFCWLAHLLTESIVLSRPLILPSPLPSKAFILPSNTSPFGSRSFLSFGFGHDLPFGLGSPLSFGVLTYSSTVPDCLLAATPSKVVPLFRSPNRHTIAPFKPSNERFLAFSFQTLTQYPALPS
ncbi:hypothetical protein V8G54_033859, partial [Vigna mungo]